MNRAPTAQQKSDALHALANLAEREGRPHAARALAEWADDLAPFVPYTDAEIREMQRALRARRLGGGR